MKYFFEKSKLDQIKCHFNINLLMLAVIFIIYIKIKKEKIWLYFHLFSKSLNKSTTNKII